MKSFKMRDLHVSAGKSISKATDDVAMWHPSPSKEEVC